MPDRSTPYAVWSRLLPAMAGLALVSAGIARTQHPQVDWVRQFGADALADDGATAIDASGNVYVGGDTQFDVFVRKCDPNGVELWTRTFGNTASKSITGIAVDEGGVVVAGSVLGFLPGSAQIGRRDAFLRKYDHDGQLLWSRQFGSSGDDELHAVAVLGGSIYATGHTSGNLSGNNGGSQDMILVKYAGDGTQVWARQMPLTGLQVARSLCLVGTTIYVAGTEGSSTAAQGFVRSFDAAGTPGWATTFGTLAEDIVYGLAGDAGGLYVGGRTRGVFSTYGQSQQGTSIDAFVAKLTLAGAVTWVRQFGSGGLDDVRGVVVDGTGVYVGGTAGGALPGAVASGNSDAFVRKYDMAGGELWTDQFGTSRTENAFALGVSPQGVVVCGSTNGVLPGQTNQTTSARRDAFLRSYSAAGAVLWTRQFGYLDPDGAFDTATAAGADGSFYVAGFTSGTFAGQTSAGDYDCYVRKYSSSGVELWTRQFGTVLADQVRGLAVTPMGVYVVGFVGSVALPGQTAAGAEDVFVRYYDPNGHEVWTRQFGSDSPDFGYAIAVDATGLSIGGRTFGALDGQPAPANFVNAFVRRCDLNGNHLWTRVFGDFAGNLESLWSVTCYGGATYVVGDTWSSFDGQTALGNSDSFLKKYDADGVAQWTRIFGTEEHDGCRAVQADARGVYVAGSTTAELPGAASNGAGDMYVRCYTHSGNIDWTRQLGTEDGDGCLALALGAGRLYAAGISGEQASVFQVDTAGTPGWSLAFSSSDFASVAGAALHGGRLALVGTTSGEILGQQSSGRNDAFLVVLSGGAGMVGGDAEAPIANAGPDQSIHVGTLVQLDGTGSNDETTATANLAYAWTLTSWPAGSSAVLAGANTAYPTLLPDQPGEYVVQLVVTDEASNVSASDTVTISSLNVAPTADAGLDQLVVVDQPAQLDGTLSDDPDLDALTWSWTIQWAPAGSLATIADAATSTPSFTPDLPGSYVLQLVVHDGFVASAADTVTVIAVTASQFALSELQAACTLIGSLPPSAFDAQGHQKSLCNQLATVARFVQQGDFPQALFHLDDVMSRVDGWTLRNSLDPKGLGQPHAADFVVAQAPQQATYTHLAAAANVLSM